MPAFFTRSERREMRKQKKQQVIKHEALLRLVQDDMVPRRAPKIVPMNATQAAYDRAMREKPLVFGIGPAGTGKTYLAAMRAAEALQNKDIERILITRPAVEAGESLGFLPGAIDEKYEPYFRPVKDAFEEFFGRGALEYHLKTKRIEARPLAYLRGSTLKNAWLIADEMQNATITQMKLLLTRIGDNAKFIINGDPSQLDIPSGKSGLIDAIDRCSTLDLVSVIKFKNDDIVRSDLCQLLVQCYQN